MRAIAPGTGAPEVTVAENQPEYETVVVAVYRHERNVRTLLTRWQPTPDERAAIARGEDIYVGQLNGGGPMTPLVVTAGALEWVVAAAKVPGEVSRA